jgi:hypothetical protein
VGALTTCDLIGMSLNKPNEINIEKHRQRLEDALILIVDEFSLSDKMTLYKLHQALCVAKRMRTDNDSMLFGDVHVVFFGDVYQLGPVGCTLLHMPSGGKSKNKHIKNRVTSWYLDLLENVFVLTVQNRFSGDTELQSMADAYRNASWTDSHVKSLNKRRKRREDIDYTRSIILVATRRERRMVYREYYRALRTLKNVCISWNANISSKSNPKESYDDVRLEINEAAFRTDTKAMRYLQGFSMFRKGELVTITDNLLVEANIANGTFAKILSFHFDPRTKFKNLNLSEGGECIHADRPPIYVMVELMIKGIELVAPFGTSIRPIWLTSQAITLSDETKYTVDNIPIVSSVCSTVHGIQGKTVPSEYYVVLTDFYDKWPSMESAAFYVALTRVKSIKQLICSRGPFSLYELQNIVPTRETREEMSRLWAKFEQTMKLFDKHSVLPKRTDGFPRFRLLDHEPFGLTNPKNTCSLNVCLQLLQCLPERFVLSPESAEDERLQQLYSALVKSPVFKSHKASKKLFLQNQELKPIIDHSGVDYSSEQDFCTFFMVNRDIIKPKSYDSSTCCPNCYLAYDDPTLCIEIGQDEITEHFDLNSYLEGIQEKKLTSTQCVMCGGDLSVTFKWQEQILIVFNRSDSGPIKTHIPFPETIDELSDSSYTLKAVVEHRMKQSKGHFVIWKSTNKFDEYYRVDDRSVSTFVNFELPNEIYYDSSTNAVQERPRTDCDSIRGLCASALLYTKQVEPVVGRKKARLEQTYNISRFLDIRIDKGQFEIEVLWECGDITWEAVNRLYKDVPGAVLKYLKQPPSYLTDYASKALDMIR